MLQIHENADNWKYENDNENAEINVYGSSSGGGSDTVQTIQFDLV